MTVIDERLDATFTALADPTRRAIVARLAAGDATVNELAAPFDMSLPGISKHLKVLERCGLITRTRRAQFRPCHLEGEALEVAVDWIETNRRIWTERFDRLETVRRERMNTVTSADGTTIAYDRQGAGPALIIVDGALCARGTKENLAELLTPDFTVYRYDRRGRGDSGDSPDTMPDAPGREVEDLAALIEEAGGTACLYGHSSGAALAMEATLRLDGAVGKLAMYEVPYDDDPASAERARRYISQLSQTLADGRPGDAVALFMAYVGTPAEQVAGLRQSPAWPAFEAIGPTLAYDHIGLLGEEFAVPTGKAARVTVPTLVMYGEAGAPFMAATARTLSRTIPDAQLRGLAAQTHDVDPKALAPVLTEFFAA